MEDWQGEPVYGGKRRKGRAGRPPLKDWTKHRWWNVVVGASASNWSAEVCWMWTRPCKGQAPMVTIRGKKVSVRRYLYQLVIPPTQAGVTALDPDILILAADSCEGELCINPHHAIQVGRGTFAAEVAAGYLGDRNQSSHDAKLDREWQAYCSYMWTWHATGVLGRHPIKDEELSYEFMQRFEKEYPGIRAEALAKAAKMNRP